MAKRTNFHNKNKDVVNDNNIASDTSSNVLDVTEPIVNNNLNGINDDKGEGSSNKIDNNQEKPMFEILNYNIVNKDKYVYLIELAKTYNIFNNIDLTSLNKTDLICLLGYFVDKLYNKDQELLNKQQELSQHINKQQNQGMSINNVSYSDVLNNLNMYKSWN